MWKQVSLLRKTSLCIVLFSCASLISFTPAPPSLVNDVLSYTNQFRKSKGRSPLVMKESLNTIARRHSENMAKGKVSFGHSGYEDRYKKVKETFKSCSMAENVAYGHTTGKAVVEMWKRSSGHRANLLGDYKYVGIGTATSNRGQVYYTQIFIR